MSAGVSGELGASLAAPDLLAARGTVREAGAFVTGACFSRDGRQVAFATGEGAVHVASADATGWREVAAHDGSVLALATDVTPGGFLSGGDDNRLCRIAADGTLAELGRGRRWVEHVASVVDGKSGWIASSAGKTVELRDAAGTLVRGYEHPSSVGGIAFDARGKRIAVSHYGGASLRFVNARADSPRLLGWKGSHLAVAIHPAGEAVVTAMQENELHGWRLADGHNMRMSGYPQKTHSLSFSRSGRWLASSGADSVVLWPFFGGGPMGRAPTELAQRPGVICRRVLFHPQQELVAAGFADGTVVLADVSTSRVLPVRVAHGADETETITALDFSPDGRLLAFGNQLGMMAIVDLSPSKEI